MVEEQLSRKHLTAAASPPVVDLTLPTQATFNDGQSSFKRTPDNSCNPPPEVDLTLPTQATFEDHLSKGHLTTAASPPMKLT